MSYKDQLHIYIVEFQTFTPATTASFFMALLTIMMASWRDLSVSSMNCSAPPLRIMVQVLAWGQPVNKLYLKKRIRAYDTYNTTMAESGAIICCIQYSKNILQIISSHYFWHQKKLTSLHRFEFPQTFHRNPARCWPGSDRWSEWSPHTPSLSSSGPRPAPDQHRTCLWIIWWKLSWIKA